MGQQRLSIGIELSTQSAKFVLLDVYGGIVHSGKFDFDEAFPQYRTKGGVLPFPSEERRHTSPFLLIEAMDRIFQTLVQDGVHLNNICAIKADAMQHCTVYANSALSKALASLSPGRTLLKQLAPAISRPTSPIWEDRSPKEEATILEGMLKDKGGLFRLCGNRAELRFPAPQIMKWAQESQAEFRQTSHILLLSAFITSILSGRIAPVDTGDGWGTNMNSLDLKRPSWSAAILSAINSFLKRSGLSGSLGDKLGRMVHYDTPVGNVSSYFAKTYGLNPEAVVLAGTGDNPATLLGCGAGVVISLGSSYTVCGRMSRLSPSQHGEFNIFGFIKGQAMALSCITNGGKVHDTFIKLYIARGKGRIKSKEWERYIAAAGRLVLRKNDHLMLPYLSDESVPLCKRGIVRDVFDDTDASTNIRALHISQALSLKLHSRHLKAPDRLCLVGGVSRNPFLRQIISDAFKAPSFSIHAAEYAAPLGCAISGARNALGITYSQAIKRFVHADNRTALEPIKKNISTAAYLLQKYSILEKKYVGKQNQGGKPCTI